MSPYVMKAMERVPASMEVGVKKFFVAPSPSLQTWALLWEKPPEVQRYFVAAGMNSIGILTGGGIGRAIASWIVNGKPDVDVTGINIDRFAPYQVTPDYRQERVVEKALASCTSVIILSRPKDCKKCKIYTFMTGLRSAALTSGTSAVTSAQIGSSTA